MGNDVGGSTKMAGGGIGTFAVKSARGTRRTKLLRLNSRPSAAACPSVYALKERTTL